MARLWMVLAWMPLAVALPPVSRTRRGFVLGLCGLSALLAAVALFGWTFDRVELARWVVELPTMKPNTAVSVLALCLALAPLGLELPEGAARVLAWSPLLAVGLMGATVFEHMTLVDLGIDQWLVADRSTPPAAYPGRTAAAAALALGMLGLALLPGPTMLRRSRLAASIVAFVVGYVASVGLLLEVHWSVGVGIAFAELSLPTAACIVMLSACALSLLQWQTGGRTHDAPVSAGARFLRGALPVAMVLPAAVMWLQHIANERGWWDASVGMVAAVAVLALVLWALVVGCARWIDGLEAELRKSQTLLEQRVSERTADLADSTARLRASQAQLAGIVDSASTAIIALDADFRIVTFNHEAERVFGVSAREMLGDTLDRLLPHRSRPGHAQSLRRFARTGDTVRRMGGEAQLHGLRADGTEFPIAASISRVALPQGALFTVVLRDLTEALALQAERTAREAAELASRSKSQLLSHVSHELRTPLNAVLGFVQLLRQNFERQPPGAGGRIDYLDHIESASHQLDRLIGDLLDLSRAEVGAMALRLRPVDAAQVLREAMAMIEQEARKQRIELVAAAADGPAMVMADERGLLQVMTNLLSNAVKYTAPGGSTRIALRDDGDRVALDVVDSGVGMSDDQLAHLFEPFNRLGREAGSVPGSGIGLALSRQLVLAMDGRIEVASRPGQGSRFTVWLPSAAAHLAPPLPPLKAPQAPASLDPAAPDSAAE